MVWNDKKKKKESSISPNGVERVFGLIKRRKKNQESVQNGADDEVWTDKLKKKELRVSPKWCR